MVGLLPLQLSFVLLNKESIRDIYEVGTKNAQTQNKYFPITQIVNSVPYRLGECLSQYLPLLNTQVISPIIYIIRTFKIRKNEFYLLGCCPKGKLTNN